MIVGNINDCARYEALNGRFKAFFDYVKAHNLMEMPAGRIVLEADNLFINIDEPLLKRKEDQLLECHRRYIDIQMPLLKPETMGWRALRTLKKSEAPFDEEKDFALYAAPASAYFEVKPGEFAVFFPEDAHAPIIGEGRQKKIIGKVRLQD